MSYLRPKHIIGEISRRWPHAWQQIKMFRADKGKNLPNWPDWCYIPIAAGVAIATQGNNRMIFEATLDSRLSPAVITAAASWRVSQGIYRFDADLYNSLISQHMDGNVPCEALKRLPEWCVYIETYNAKFRNEIIEGFWAHLEHDVNDGRMELRLVLMLRDGVNLPVPIHLGEWTLEEGLRKMQEESDKQAAKHMPGFKFPEIDFINDISPLVQLVLYLCADNIDMPTVPSHPKTRVRMSGQVDVPKEPRIWVVGERVGAAIRKYRNKEEGNAQTAAQANKGTHASPRPHVRAAHWHHFWTGPRTGERKLVLHWLPPIPVGMNEYDSDMPAVIHKVK